MPPLAGKTVAFIGLGIMGASMAANLARAGASVTGWNRTVGKPQAEIAKEAGVKIADSIKDAVENSDFVFSCLGDERDAEQVLTGEVCDYARSGSLIVDFSTIGPTAAQSIAAVLNKRGLRFLDAPVTGGDVGAKNGTLTILVGGDSKNFDQCKPLMEAMGKRIFLCGPIGAGQAVKLSNQILCAVNLMAVSEAFALADKMGIDKNLLVETLAEGAGGSWSLANLGPRIARDDFAPGFTLGHMLKDLRLAKENSTGERLPGTDLAIGLFEEAQRLGGERQGTQSMFRVYACRCEWEL